MAVSRKVTLDREANAGYLTLADAPVERTVDYGPFTVDYSAEGDPVGVEARALDRHLDGAAVLRALEEAGAEPDADTREWVHAFVALVLDPDGRVPDPDPPSQRGSGPPLEEVRFLTVAEVALLLRVSRMTVYRMVHTGTLSAIRVGRSYRVPERAVHGYLRERGVEPGEPGTLG